MPIVRFQEGLHVYAVLYGSCDGVSMVARIEPMSFEDERTFLDRINDLAEGDTLGGYGHVELRRWKAESGHWHTAAELVVDVLTEPEGAKPQLPAGLRFPERVIRPR